ARSLVTGDLIYVEYHYLDLNGAQHPVRRVDYIDADGHRFASKLLVQDTTYPYVPSLDWEDIDTDTTIIGRLQNNQYIQTITQPESEETVTAQLTSPGTVAFDAAFDQFLIDHLAQLMTDGRLGIEFLTFGAGRTYTFQAEVTHQDNDLMVVEVRPKNALFRWFVDPIELTYNIADRRLTHFSGVTNFSRNGDLVEARIAYEYQ
ncbi:MAG: hypothetical protein WED11_06810, partial [Natronospirillum sp.]